MKLITKKKSTGSQRKITSTAMFSDYEYKCSCIIPKDNNQQSSQFNETFIDMKQIISVKMNLSYTWNQLTIY